LEKAFDRVPREVITPGYVDERLVSDVLTMYVDAVFGNSEVSDVGIGKHQSSGLSPLLFAIVTVAISWAFRVGLPW